MIVCEKCKETGGRFVLRGDKWYHKGRCVSPTAGERAAAGNLFPYTTMNIGDPNHGPVEVQSLRHLRQLEREHGVISEPFNNDQSYQGERY